MSDETAKLILEELREINRKLDGQFAMSISRQQILQIGCQHEYPNPWFSTSPPFCKKCGQQAPTLQPFYTTS